MSVLSRISSNKLKKFKNSPSMSVLSRISSNKLKKFKNSSSMGDQNAARVRHVAAPIIYFSNTTLI